MMTHNCRKYVATWALLGSFVGCGVTAPSGGGTQAEGKLAEKRTEKRTEERTGERAIKVKKLALLVGIDKYKYKSIRPLKGGKNDVASMKRLLVESFGFPDDEANIRILTDEQATHKMIVQSFKQHLIAKADAETIVVFHYCGHGSQKRDAEGGDEPDGWDETLVPYDSGRKKDPNDDITDDELNGLMAALNTKTEHVTFIFDSCHSGSATRDVGAARSRKVDRDERGASPTAPVAGVGEKDDGLRPANASYTLISGARDNEEAKEKKVGGKWYGALTWYLTEEIRNAVKTKEGVTYRDIMDHVKAKVSSEYRTQHPVLHGVGNDSADKLVFGARSLKAEPYVEVSKVSGSKVHLKAGQVHGVTEGSIYEVYPPGTKDFAESSKVRVEVVKVGVTESTAKVIEGAVLEAQSRAVEREHRYHDAKIRVHFKNLEESEWLRKIRKDLVEGFEHIEEAEEETEYDLLIEERDGKIVTEGAEPNEISPGVDVSAPDVTETVRKQITAWAKWLNVLRLRNQDPDVKVKLTIKSAEVQSRGGSSFMERKADLELLEDDRFRIEIKNTSKLPLYVTLLDLDSEGAVVLVWPEPGEAQEELAPGTTWSRERDLEAWLPEGVDYTRDVLKIVATDVPCDFSFLQNDAVRGGIPHGEGARGEGPNPLEQLMAKAALGTRAVRLIRRKKAPKCTTLEKVFEVRRKTVTQ